MACTLTLAQYGLSETGSLGENLVSPGWLRAECKSTALYLTLLFAVIKLSVNLARRVQPRFVRRRGMRSSRLWCTPNTDSTNLNLPCKGSFVYDSIPKYL